MPAAIRLAMTLDHTPDQNPSVRSIRLNRRLESLVQHQTMTLAFANHRSNDQ